MKEESLQQQAMDKLKQRKKSFRRYMYGLSPTEKIRHLDLLQRRYYAILEAPRTKRRQADSRTLAEMEQSSACIRINFLCN